MDYMFLFLSVLCTGFQFIFAKIYQTKVGNGVITSLLFMLFSGITASILLLCICAFHITINSFALLMAAGEIICAVGYNVVGMKMMSLGKVAVYTMFLMLGGMFVPSLYGIIFLGEPVTLWKIIGTVLLIIALVLPTLVKSEEKSNNIKLFTVLGIVVFLLNGMVGIFNKMHQISPNAIPTLEFSLWQNMICVIVISFVFLIYAFINKKAKVIVDNTKEAMPVWWSIVLFSIISQTGGILLLLAAKTVDASVMYPILTGGVIVITALFGFFFYKEKINLFIGISIILSIVSTALFLL